MVMFSHSFKLSKFRMHLQRLKESPQIPRLRKSNYHSQESISSPYPCLDMQAENLNVVLPQQVCAQQPATLWPVQQVIVLPQSKQLLAMLTVIRDREAPRRDFIASVDRLCRFVVEEGLNHIPMIEKTIFTPSGFKFKGYENSPNVCGVPVLRAGEAMEKSLRDIIPDIRIAKVLVQRDPKTKEANLFYSKFPPNIAEQFCLVMDPILATGGSAIAAIEALCLNGVQVSNIIFLCIVSCPEGLNALTTRFPKIKIITSTVGDHLDERKYVIPDTFDIGCRYYGTD